MHDLLFATACTFLNAIFDEKPKEDHGVLTVSSGYPRDFIDDGIV